jgi:site-specific DNA-methyltransferase (adenine-specific)
MTAHTIILGDSREMTEVPEASVHLIVTSPPYWQLKDYGAVGQIGFDDSYEEYINNLNLVWAEAHRVLHGGCRLCVVIGDQFARSVYYGRYKIIPIKTEIIRFCETMGFDYMGAIVWQKVTTCNTSGGATIMGSYPYPRNGVVKLDYETILLFKKTGLPPAVSKETKVRSALSLEEWNLYFSGHWHLAGKKQDRHLAVFPEELAKRLIRMFSFVGETVLDPFLGSGTTSLAAKMSGRNSIGYEINRLALPVIERKLGMDRLIGREAFTVIEQEKQPIPWREQWEQLPYTFKDQVRVTRGIDPRKRDFGSKIELGRARKQEFYSVKEVLSPEELTLNNGRVVALLGVRQNRVTNREAVAFLERLTRNQKVFLKTDQAARDVDGRLCYLYLKNRTFVNARLIKSGLVDVDASLDYEKRDRFIGYLRAGPESHVQGI